MSIRSDRPPPLLTSQHCRQFPRADEVGVGKGSVCAVVLYCCGIPGIELAAVVEQLVCWCEQYKNAAQLKYSIV